MAEITALIRYKNSAKTLPEVLSALKKQSLQPDRIIGVDTGSSDESGRLLEQAGAKIIKWNEPYHHSKVLNFGVSHCETPLVLCLSSHTVLLQNDGLARLAEPMQNELICASSVKWDKDPFYTDEIDWQELQKKGMKFGSIYSNSAGIFRKALWKDYPFDETINGMEDYDWALQQIRSGFRVARVEAPISYQRNAHNRDMRETARTCHLSHRYGLKVCWLGVVGAIKGLLRNLPGRLAGNKEKTDMFNTCGRRLVGTLFWKKFDLNIN